MRYIIPPWMKVLEEEYNKSTHEIAGPAANPNILKYHQCTTLKATSDEIPWCSACENFIIQNCGLGYKGTGSAQAISWLKWGKELKTGRYGAIAVFDNGDGTGHVTNFLCVCEDDPDYGWFIGGNQGDEIKISRYLLSDVASFRWPNSFGEQGGYG